MFFSQKNKLPVIYKMIAILCLTISFIPKINTAFSMEKFYNYYENGLDYMNRKDWNRAIEEFKSAVSLEFEDSKRKRIYGTRFIPYFPHREMGISYYYLGENEEALKELKLSVAFKKSKRAKIFIDRIDKGEIAPASESVTVVTKNQPKAEQTVEEKPVAKEPVVEKSVNQKTGKKITNFFKKQVQPVSKKKVPVGALTYDPSRVTQVGSRLSVAVMPFDHKGGSETFGKSVTDKMITQLVNLRRFRVIERNALEDVMKEQSFGLSGMVDEKTAIKVGKMVGADVIITGSVFTDENYGKVSARVINTETSETIVAKEAQSENTQLENIEKLVANVAIAIYNDLPLVEGNIIKVENDLVYVDIGMDSGIMKGTKCVAFSEGEAIINPATKEVLGKKVKKLGEIIVEQVQEKMSIARIIESDGSIEAGDKVVVK